LPILEACRDSDKFNRIFGVSGDVDGEATSEILENIMSKVVQVEEVFREHFEFMEVLWFNFGHLGTLFKIFIQREKSIAEISSYFSANSSWGSLRAKRIKDEITLGITHPLKFETDK
jgi:hypothetical protein